MKTPTVDEIRDALRAVMDPEIPTASIVDLGIVHDVRLADERIEIDLLPTFAGCPALDIIREDVEKVARDLDGASEVAVRFVNVTPWTTDRINGDGARALNAYGIASPLLQIGRAHAVTCPYCGSNDTVEEGAFGSTPCRTVRYCKGCRNPFESFKTKR